MDATVIADAGYDSDGIVAVFRTRVAFAGGQAEPKTEGPRLVDWHPYRDRNVVERFRKVKHYRWVVTRYD